MKSKDPPCSTSQLLGYTTWVQTPGPLLENPSMREKNISRGDFPDHIGLGLDQEGWGRHRQVGGALGT